MQVRNSFGNNPQNERYELNSSFGWLIFRVGGLGMWIIFGVPLLIMNPLEGGIKYFFIGGFIVHHLLLHSFAYGYADNQGIHYKTLFVFHHVSWADVEKVVWYRRTGINVYLKNTSFWHRRIIFGSQWNEKIGFLRALQEYFGLRSPELVEWLQRKVLMHNLNSEK